MIKALIRQSPLLSLRHGIAYKLYYGQAGTLNFSLKNRTYHFFLETAWEDCCTLDIEGLTGIPSPHVYEDGPQAYFNDDALNKDLNEHIKVLFKLPADYGLIGKIHGNIQHIKGNCSSELRSLIYDIEILGSGFKVELGKVETTDFQLKNINGSVNLNSLTCDTALATCDTFSAQKFRCISQAFISATSSIKIRSTFFTGSNRKRLFKSKNIDIDSVSGYSRFQCETLRIKDLYAKQNEIDIRCNSADLIVESGTGVIEYASESALQADIFSEKLASGQIGSIYVSKPQFTVEGNKLIIT